MTSKFAINSKIVDFMKDTIFFLINFYLSIVVASLVAQW